MTRTTRLVLTGLARGPLHGYGIIRWVESTTRPSKRIAVATMYSALDRLARDGLVEVDREEIEQGRTRRYYRLTDSGQRALVAELATLEQELDSAKDQVSGLDSSTPQAGLA